MIFVRNWLVIGSATEATNAELIYQHNIGAAVMLGSAYPIDTVPMRCLPLASGMFLTPSLIHEAVEFIHEQRNWGRRILIACDSPPDHPIAVAIAAIKHKSGGISSLTDVYRSLLKQQPHANVDPGLWQSLCAYFRDEPSFDVLHTRVQQLVQHTT